MSETETKSTFWPSGPRDWSPRYFRGNRNLEKLKAAFPKDMVYEMPVAAHRDLKEATVLVVRYDTWADYQKRSCPEYVSMRNDGTLLISWAIIELLHGRILGYEHLAGRWPWPGKTVATNGRIVIGSD